MEVYSKIQITNVKNVNVLKEKHNVIHYVLKHHLLVQINQMMNTHILGLNQNKMNAADIVIRLKVLIYNLIHL